MKQSGRGLLVVLFLFLVTGIAGADSVLKDFKLRTIDNSTMDLNALAGRPIVINIGTHW